MNAPARADSIQSEALSLRAILEDCILSLQHKLEVKEFNITLDVSEEYVQNTNKQLFVLLINNLIENAIAFSSNKELLIRVTDDELLFENIVSHEFENTIIEHLTNRNVRQRSSEGFGQGLYLVKRIMETLDWGFDISSEEKCYRFLIRFNR
jgi:signal transduction histidine kinase